MYRYGLVITVRLNRSHPTASVPSRGLWPGHNCLNVSLWPGHNGARESAKGGRVDELRWVESNHLPPGYEPGELPVLYSARLPYRRIVAASTHEIRIPSVTSPRRPAAAGGVGNHVHLAQITQSAKTNRFRNGRIHEGLERGDGRWRANRTGVRGRGCRDGVLVGQAALGFFEGPAAALCAAKPPAPVPFLLGSSFDSEGACAGGRGHQRPGGEGISAPPGAGSESVGTGSRGTGCGGSTGTARAASSASNFSSRRRPSAANEGHGFWHIATSSARSSATVIGDDGAAGGAIRAIGGGGLDGDGGGGGEGTRVANPKGISASRRVVGLAAHQIPVRLKSRIILRTWSR